MISETVLVALQHIVTMNLERKVFLAGFITAVVLVGISAYFFMVFQALNSKSKQLSRSELEQMTREELIDHILIRQAEGGAKLGYYVLPIAVFISAIVGTAVAYVLMSRSEASRRRARINARILLNLLRDDERVIVEKILEHGGEMRQYELVHSTGMNKVKVHRILKALEDRGVVVIEKIGKVNNLRLRKELYEALKE